MFHCIQQIVLRRAVWIVTGNTRTGPGLDALVGGKETVRGLLMTLRAKLLYRSHEDRREVRTVAAVAGRAIFGCRRMQGAVTPELCNFLMALKT